MPDQEQIEEARSCDIDTLMVERYPDDVGPDELLDHYPVETPCDWAILAAAYALRAEQGMSLLEQGQFAWAEAVSANAAYGIADPLIFSYSGARDAVAAPPFTQEPLTDITIHYEWLGLGDPHFVEYSVSISKAHEAPEVAGTVDGEPYDSTLSADTAQTLGMALTGLLPVGRTADLEVCHDNSPNWTVVLTFQGGEKVELRTHGSNMYDYGGPWWVTIDEQLYIQPSDTILVALGGIVMELGLPVGIPAATLCYGLESRLLDLLY
jgi:hypothetical protein